jgi:hypothetical protein
MKISNSQQIILHHEAEWARIVADENDKQSLLRYGMAMIIIAYALVFVLSLLFGMSAGYGGVFSSTYIIISVVIQFVLAVASLYFIPMILAALAPSFGGKNDTLNALKLFVFAETPAWIGLAISRIPVLGILAIIAGAVFAIYLFWQHVGDAMSIPSEKKVGYVVVAVVVLGVIYIVIGAIGGAIANIVSPVSYHIGGY